MKISIKIEVGSSVEIQPGKGRVYKGTVEKILSPDVFDVLVNHSLYDQSLRLIHISQIAAFTFGDIWMENHDFIKW